MKNWISTLMIFLLGTSLAGCGTTKSESASQPQQQASSCQRTTSSPKSGKLVATSKEEIAMQATNDKNVPVKKEKVQQEPSTPDKFLSLWRNLPSPQWFVNDVKQQDVG